jgi:hypothetical protein
LIDALALETLAALQFVRISWHWNCQAAGSRRAPCIDGEEVPRSEGTAVLDEGSDAAIMSPLPSVSKLPNFTMITIAPRWSGGDNKTVGIASKKTAAALGM